MRAMLTKDQIEQYLIEMNNRLAAQGKRRSRRYFADELMPI